VHSLVVLGGARAADFLHVVGRAERPGRSLAKDPTSRYAVHGLMNHFTNRTGYNAIGSQKDWCFEASDPPADHPTGAYFTTLSPQAPNLAVRLRIPREKLEFVFGFHDAGDLRPLQGGRGTYIFYSPTDYVVVEARQQFKGATGL
jgi:hypothetical protein